MDFYKNFVQFIDIKDEQAYALCPFHKEKVPSFTVNVQTAQWYCHGCGEGGGYVSFLQKLLGIPKDSAMEIVNDYKAGKGLPFPSEEIVEEAYRCLKSNSYAHQLINSWGVTDEQIDKYKIGFSNGENRYYFPIRTQYGFLANIRRYMPAEFREKNSPKCLGIKKCNDSRFWPWDAFDKETIFVVEGEKDCLVARSQGLNAVTGTGGSNVPTIDYSVFRGKKVYIMTDADQAGEELARKYIDIISGQTNEIKRILLPTKDFTEYFMKYRDANVLQFSKQVDYDLRREEIQAKHMTLVESEAAANIGERALFDNMIVTGSDPKTYAIPCVVCLRCEGSEACKRPCKLYGGRTTLELEFDDRDLIHMIDSPDRKMIDLAVKACGCKKISVTPTKYVNAQRIIFQEKASLLGGLDDATFDPRYGFYLYDKDRLSPTSKYTFDARKVTDPRTQKVYYSIKNAKIDDKEFSEPIDVNYFAAIAKKYKSVLPFLNDHYKRWAIDCGVYGRLDLFSTYMLTMCSVTEIPYKGQTVKGCMDVIAIGDTRTGKSLLAQNMLRKLNMGGYVNGENARMTGVLGGVVRMGDSWLITWGAIPLNDKGFLTIDEATGLSVEDITQMSSARSSCVATINKVVRGEARARTRLFWIANSRSGKNTNEYFWKGFGAFQEFIPVNEDQARFDLVIGASRDDIDDVQDIQGEPLSKETVQKYRNLIYGAWTIDAEYIRIEDYGYLHKVTKELCDEYNGGTLLIKEAAYEKVLRIACALSILAGSFDDDMNLIVTKQMLDWAVEYLRYIFDRSSIDYKYYVKKVQEEEKLMRANTEYATALCNQYPALKVLLNNTKFRGTQMAEILGIDKDTTSKLLSQMLLRGLIKMTTGGMYSPSVSLINIVRALNKPGGGQDE